MHISELADHKVENPEDVVKVGQEIEVKVLRVDADERKIGLSRRPIDWSGEEAAEGGAWFAAAKPQLLQPHAGQELEGSVGGGSGPLIAPRAAQPEGEE